MSNLITRQIRLEVEQVRFIESLASIKEQTKSQVYRRALSLGIEQLKRNQGVSNGATKENGLN